MAEPSGTRDDAQVRTPVVTPGRVVAGLCLIVPFVAMLWVSSYARVDPALIGIPFFYWYQMLWVLLSAGLTSVAYALIRRERRERRELRMRNGGASK